MHAELDLTPLAGSATPDVVRRLGAITAANIGDAQERIGVASGLSPVWARAKLAGPAYTVWTRAKSLGSAGFVIDGAVRDADALAECGLPIWPVCPSGL